MKVSAVSATIADSDIEIAATEYSTSPSEAATSTMQMATKIVEIRITRVKVLKHPEPGPFATLALLLIRQAGSLLRTQVGVAHQPSFPGQRSAQPLRAVRCRAGAVQ